MKKVFLLLGIAGFTTASAQQKDVFDINRYLKKKNAEKSITIPKIKLGFQKPNIFQRNPDKIPPGFPIHCQTATRFILPLLTTCQ